MLIRAFTLLVMSLILWEWLSYYDLGCKIVACIGHSGGFLLLFQVITAAWKLNLSSVGTEISISRRYSYQTSYWSLHPLSHFGWNGMPFLLGSCWVSRPC